jgi:NTP pyrophosphatase (non-canonical NTP hydrolase)
MDFKHYSETAGLLRVYPVSYKEVYPLMGLMGEVGEVAEKLKKELRDGNKRDKEALTKELGDVLWYLNALALDCGIALDDIAETNLRKLTDRKARGKLQGSGDNR